MAGTGIILGTLLVAVICYAVGLANVPNGIDTPAAVIPEFLALMFVAGILGVAASTGAFLISIFLQWLRSKWTFSVWLPLLLVPSLVFLVTLLTVGPTRGMDFVVLVTGMAFLHFGIYWTLLSLSGVFLDFFRRLLWKKNPS